MDALFSSSPYERVVFMKGAQIGGMGLNVVLVGLFALRLLEHLNRQAERFESRGRIGCKQYRPDLREGAESRSHCI